MGHVKVPQFFNILQKEAGHLQKKKIEARKRTPHHILLLSGCHDKGSEVIVVVYLTKY